MPKSAIESEVIPYLNSLIENGASYVWLQDFYLEKIKIEVANAIDSLPVNNILGQLHLVRLFVDNEAVNHPEKHQKLMPIRILFRHSDDLASDLQSRLSKEILIHFSQAPNYFLAQNTEKILETLLHIQILLEMRARLNDTTHLLVLKKYPVQIKDHQAWLIKQIHSHIPVPQRRIKNESKTNLPKKPKWNFSKGQFGYDTGPGSIWYFFHGETKFVLYLQREILSLIAIGLTFRDKINDVAKQKFNTENFLINFPMAGALFLFQLINLSFSPYRLFRTLLAEINQFIYYFVRTMYENLLPTKHCNKPALYLMTLSMQIALYTTLLLSFGFPYEVFPVFWITPMQISLMFSASLVVYNGATLILGLGKYLYELKVKSDVKKAQLLTTINDEPIQRPPLSTKSPVYTPSINRTEQHSLRTSTTTNKPSSSSSLSYLQEPQKRQKSVMPAKASIQYKS